MKNKKLMPKLVAVLGTVFCVMTVFHGTAFAGPNTAPKDKLPEISNDERKQLANCDGTSDPQKCLKENPIIMWLQYGINFLAVGAGVSVTIMIIIGGIQYAAAGSNPQAVLAARKRISNAIIAMVAFFFLYAFMQYLVPGGIF